VYQFLDNGLSLEVARLLDRCQVRNEHMRVRNVIEPEEQHVLADCNAVVQRVCHGADGDGIRYREDSVRAPGLIHQLLTAARAAIRVISAIVYQVLVKRYPSFLEGASVAFLAVNGGLTAHLGGQQTYPAAPLVDEVFRGVVACALVVDGYAQYIAVLEALKAHRKLVLLRKLRDSAAVELRREQHGSVHRL